MTNLSELQELIKNRIDELQLLLEKTNEEALNANSSKKYKLYGQSKNIRAMIELNRKVFYEVSELIIRYNY